MKKRILTALTAGMALFFVAAVLFASTPDKVIKMENSIYKKRKKGSVKFSHEKHADVYKVKGKKIGCGECHHDANNKPITNLKYGDPVKSCAAAECHPSPKKVKGKGNKWKSYKKAVHANCKGCHKIVKNEKKAPNRKCNSCHAKKGK